MKNTSSLATKATPSEINYSMAAAKKRSDLAAKIAKEAKAVFKRVRKTYKQAKKAAKAARHEIKELEKSLMVARATVKRVDKKKKLRPRLAGKPAVRRRSGVKQGPSKPALPNDVSPLVSASSE